MSFSNPAVLSGSRKQRTLKEPVSYSGIGIHTGRCAAVRLLPAAAGTGIVFKRVDLPDGPLIPATVEHVADTSRSTTLGIGDVRIHTVEHLLAPLSVYGIDNVLIEINTIEPPVADGSSAPFVEMIEKAGIVEQEEEIAVASLTAPLYWSEKEIHIVALPSDSFRVSYTLSYPGSRVLSSQYRSLEITPESFKNEIAPCRTFSRYEEVSMLMDLGLIKGGSLDNAVIVKDDVIFSKGGLRFPDEMARHKILDLIGDLSLVGAPFTAHIIAIRSGHQANFHFAKQLQSVIEREYDTADR